MCNINVVESIQSKLGAYLQHQPFRNIDGQFVRAGEAVRVGRKVSDRNPQRFSKTVEIQLVPG